MKKTIELIAWWVGVLGALCVFLALFSDGISEIFGSPRALPVYVVGEDSTPWLFIGGIVAMFFSTGLYKLSATEGEQAADEDTGATEGEQAADENFSYLIALPFILGFVCFVFFFGAVILSKFGVFPFGVPDWWKAVIIFSGGGFIVCVGIVLIYKYYRSQKSE